MSIWIYSKEKNGKQSIFSVTIPLEVVVLLLGLLSGLLWPRYISDAPQLGKDAIALVLVGFFLFLISKISLFKNGIYNSWGPKRMKKPFGWLYFTGYLLMVIGAMVTLKSI